MYAFGMWEGFTERWVLSQDQEWGDHHGVVGKVGNTILAEKARVKI